MLKLEFKNRMKAQSIDSVTVGINSSFNLKESLKAPFPLEHAVLHARKSLAINLEVHNTKSKLDV